VIAGRPGGVSIKEFDKGTAPAPPAPASTPVLILTTGTTGAQNGARHAWGRLLAGVRHPDERPGTRWLLAYNLNRFAGIHFMLHALASRATLIVPASRRADDVIARRRRSGAWWSAGFRVAAGALQQITLGGEAAPAGLMSLVRALQCGADAGDTELIVTGVGVAADEARAELRAARTKMLGLLDDPRLERELQSAGIAFVSQRYEGSGFNIPSKLIYFMASGCRYSPLSTPPAKWRNSWGSRAPGGWSTPATPTRARRRWRGCPRRAARSASAQPQRAATPRRTSASRASPSGSSARSPM
jgi:hypothetical protein